ncbi:TIGR03503 family protein [Thalassotalea sp. M1531]|uniref:TIGR03503 family protein n=1 Tax=Thalassotalea algicola TaxID=2716224 RepID=A0A7Y0Q7K4_9GAMM|nr:TIGR03503 family protein [Thalassotalea algicola]NMP32493.1 TIGR03503 family protein [Thalassotalea algicola]
MAQVGWSFALFSLTVLFNAYAQEVIDNTLENVPAEAEQVKKSMPSAKIDYYDVDNVTNQIPYFDNRFRIDAELEEITLLFYRKMGSPPIILVRPDGSKLKINQLDKEKVQWFDDRTFDMVKIKKPMPGPWQVIGQVEPGSHIMVMSEVRIDVAPLPEVMLSGETLKITGKLFNGEFAIDTPTFKDVVRLDVDFFSTNNSAFNNFGAEPVQLTSFRDDGRNLDEYANDGVFTGEFELTFAPGEWVPIYHIKLPMASRELRQKPIIVQPNPITLEAEPTAEIEEFHKIHFLINKDLVNPDSLIFQGKITYPDRQEEPFSIMEGAGDSRTHEVGYTEPGIHRVKVSAFGETIHGREFRLVVPEYTFNVERKAGAMISVVNEDGDIVQVAQEVNEETLEAEPEKISVEEELALIKEQKLAEQEAEQKETLMFIGIANGVVFFMAALGFGIYYWRRRKKQKTALQE